MGESLKKILVMAGGTGGHVFPALVIAKKLKSYGAQVSWLGTRRGLESELVPQAGFSIDYISVVGIRRTGIFNLFISPFRILIACAQTFFILKKIKPDCVLGMGGFVSGPGGLIAWLLRKPLVIHEQNAVIGVTNKILSKLATKIFLGFPGVLKKSNVEVIGNPVREEIIAIAEPAERFVERKGPLRLLILGGSLGALALNQLVVEALASMAEEDRPVVWHQTGKQHYESAKKTYQEKNISGQIMPFIDDMPAAYAWADCVLCRSGAMTISELMAVGVASILVPFPFAVDDHQTHNSAQLVESGGAICIQQRDLSASVLMNLLMELQSDRERLLKMAQAARDLNKMIGNAAERIAKECLEVCKN